MQTNKHSKPALQTGRRSAKLFGASGKARPHQWLWIQLELDGRKLRPLAHGEGMWQFWVEDITKRKLPATRPCTYALHVQHDMLKPLGQWSHHKEYNFSKASGCCANEVPKQVGP
eukprot:2659952-Amphidinium_carterae.1